MNRINNNLDFLLIRGFFCDFSKWGSALNNYLKGGTNSNLAHLGLLDPSSRKLMLLKEATLLAWESWVASSAPIFAINRGRSEEEKGSAVLALLSLSKLLRKIISMK